MSKLMLLIYILVGEVEPKDGLYTVYYDNTVYEYACYGEVIHWIETGEFKYDDFLCEAGEIE